MGYFSSSSSIFVLTLVILFCSIQSSSAQITVLSSPSGIKESEFAYSSDASKVTLALHYETLCPYCSNFMVNYLPQIFTNGLIDIIDLQLIPYGNAKITFDKVITCQHGPTECELNTVEACALQVWPAQDKHFNFINCVETFVYNGQQSQWKSCYSKLGYEEQPINECYNSGLGQQLELGYAKATGALNPPHKYVPWVTVNDVPLYDDYRSFQTYVCNAYQGTKPAACQGQRMDIIPNANSNQMLEVTFMEETSPTTNIKSPMAKARRQMKF
ncbi:gamma-interferon-responsive lysosomal thiol protein-like [Papaver somniferum]|uniref:gamma-interferon-responsive lysosomal thiol protein-like n=1 Tax=Papaver somniferum TaxID=3469 RepID=UPI000E7013ED|nr:gamma-interferon-responsive lysosomal thiol protein-like [Papaver somniferum]